MGSIPPIRTIVNYLKDLKQDAAIYYGLPVTAKLKMMIF
jgi:hypothetical protein